MKPHPIAPTVLVHDYGPAVRSAVSWLGDRYLLASPVTARLATRRNPSFFPRPDPWHPIHKPGS